MSKSRETERVLEILRRAAGSQPVPDGGHFVDDDELLACWSAGLLSAAERQNIIEHLATCPACRHDIAERVRRHILELPDVEVSEPQDISDTPSYQADPPEQSTSSPAHQATAARPRPPLRSSWRQSPWLRFAVAAGILACVGAIWWLESSSGPARALARANRDLQAGRADQALVQTERLLAKKLTPADQARAKQLLEEAGYRVADAKLRAKDFQEVLEIDHRVARLAPDSGRLANLRLQAERGIPAEYALSDAGSLATYGYEMDGSSRRKSLPVIDQTTERLEKEYQTAIAAHPRDAGLLLNRGQFLLSQARADEARRCFETVLAQDGQNPIAQLGLGLSDFEEGKPAAALAHFETAARLDPHSLAASFNLAVCLQALHRPAEAAKCWQQVLRLTNDAQLRARIESHLLEMKQ